MSHNLCGLYESFSGADEVLGFENTEVQNYLNSYLEFPHREEK